MASLYKPKIITYRLPDGSYRTADGERVTKGTPGAVKEESVSAKWYGRYTAPNGKQVRVPLSESKETSRRMLAKLTGDAELAGVGIVDPFAEHPARPLAEHLEDFGRYLFAKGNVPEHVHKTMAQCQAILDGCKFRFIDDLQASTVVEFLAGLRQEDVAQLDPRKEWYTVAELSALCGIRPDSVRRLARRGFLKGDGQGQEQRYHRDAVAVLLARRGRGIGVETSNHYLAAIKAFSRWLVKDRRTGVDPLFHLSRQNADVDRRHQPRALPEESFFRFVEATAAGRTFRGLSGADRLVLYTLAANTGLGPASWAA